MLLSNEIYHHDIFFVDNYCGSSKHIGRSLVFFSGKDFKLSSEQNSKCMFENGSVYFQYAYVCGISVFFPEINYTVLGYSVKQFLFLTCIINVHFITFTFF